MRKIITSSVFILLFTLFSGSVFAGKYDYECGEFKKQKQLYGLCNAYQNALAHDDVDAMADIERNWDKRVDENGEPELPGRIDGNQGCLCWSEIQMCDAVNGASEGTYIKGIPSVDDNGSVIGFNGAEIFFAAGTSYEGLICIYQNSYYGIYERFETTPQQDELCRAAIDLIIKDEVGCG